MVDRLFPGSSAQSFLRDNSVLSSVLNEGGTYSIDQVATTPTPRHTVDTVPVTDYDAATSQPAPNTPTPTVELPPTNVPVAEAYCPCNEKKKSTIQQFISKDKFKSGRVPSSALDRIADGVKTTLTGGDKADKNIVEGFCDEHWHGVAISVLFVIAVIAISLSTMAFLGVIHVTNDCFDKCCGVCKGSACGLSGGGGFLF